MIPLAAQTGVPLCLMHSKGDPKTMQSRADYGDVVVEVYEYLRQRRDTAMAAGVAQHNIVLDPGIGFGKTLEHNLALLRDMAVFHGLGCPLLIGASRKAFIGTLTGTKAAGARMPGSVTVALYAAAQGAQMLRVHDVAETGQALTIQSALWGETAFAASPLADGKACKDQGKGVKQRTGQGFRQQPPAKQDRPARHKVIDQRHKTGTSGFQDGNFQQIRHRRRQKPQKQQRKQGIPRYRAGDTFHRQGKGQ